MKILVVHLLRLGDFLQSTPVIEGLRIKHPGARVDALVFKGVDRVATVFGGVDHWWTLNRDDLQDGLGRADVPLLTALDVLSETLLAIEAEGYDLVINLSHTQFSSRVAGLIATPARLGAFHDADGVGRVDSPWFAYLDLHARRPGADVFHHLDVFWLACGLRGLTKSWTYAFDKIAAADNLIACQPFTSDAAKDWGVERWVEALTQVRARDPRASFAILGAPAEAARVREIVARVPGAYAAITTLKEVLSIIAAARVLITGDTAIKHLAAGTRTPVIELCLGPSEYRRTGLYRAHGCIVTTPNGAADEINPSLVVDLIDRALNERGFDSTAMRPGTRVLKPTVFGGFWCAVDARVLDQRPPALAHLDFTGGDEARGSTPTEIRVKLIETLRATFTEAS